MGIRRHAARCLPKLIFHPPGDGLNKSAFQLRVDLILLNSDPTAGHGKKAAAFHWLVHLGMPGVFAVALIDASPVPLAIPGSTDLLLLWLISHHGNPYAMVGCAIVGSMLGSLTTWKLGKKGGEAGFKRYIPRRYQDRVMGWSQRHPLLSVFLPPLLPPPVPLWPFLLAAGALGVSWQRYLACFGASRAARYCFVGWLAVHYGRKAVKFWAVLDKWSVPVLSTFAVLSIAGLAYGFWKLRRAQAESGNDSALQPHAAD